MPWKAEGNNIVRADTGKVVGHSTSHAKAAASVRARYANSGGESFAHRGASMVTRKPKAKSK
jgi:hypothetical protein